MKILDRLYQETLPALTEHTSRYLEISEDQTRQAYNSALPLLTGHLLEVYGQPDGDHKIYDLALYIDSKIPDEADSFLAEGRPSFAILLNDGAAVLNLITAGRAASMTDGVAENSKLRAGTASSIIRIAAAILFKHIGKEARNQKFDAHQLQDHLEGQIPTIGSTDPDYFAGTNQEGGEMMAQRVSSPLEKLSFPKSTPAAEDMPSEKDLTQNQLEDSPGLLRGILTWLIPAVILLFILCFVGLRSCNT